MSLWARQFRLRSISVWEVQNICVDVRSTCDGTEQINLSNLFGVSFSGRSCTCRSAWCGSGTVWKLTFLCCKTASWQGHSILRHTTSSVPINNKTGSTAFIVPPCRRGNWIVVFVDVFRWVSVRVYVSVSGSPGRQQQNLSASFKEIVTCY